VINLTEKIKINADNQTVWAFLTDFSKSLSFNRFHNSIEIPSSFSMNNKTNFVIEHNFGFGAYEMEAKITKCNPPVQFSISEVSKDEPNKGFSHSITFSLSGNDENTLLLYSLEGTYGRRVQDLSFKPILKGVMKNELRQLKNAIESSQQTEDHETSKSYNPI
jgi:carbon monoxide dehydrogenase subunit G